MASLCLGAVVAFAQAPSGRIIDREPFDRIQLDAANGNKVLIVRPLKFPDRRVPDPPQRRGKLPKVFLFDDPQEYEVEWKDIGKEVDDIQLYESMVLAEANAFTAAGKFDEAYEYFVFLLDRYPDTEGLKEGQQAYLYASAGAAFKQQKYDEALAICEELLAQNSAFRAAGNAPSLMQVLGGIADKVISRYVEAENFAAARTLLLRLANQHRASSEPFIVRWRDQLAGQATDHRERAREHLAARRFIEAYDACAAMNRIWPDVEGGPALAADIARQYPLVRVGVDQPALEWNAGSLANPAARRAGRLVERRLFEFLGPGPEGGRYLCPLGTVEQSDDGLQVIFHLNPPAQGRSLNAYELSRLLLGWTRPGAVGFQPAWARALKSVEVAGPREVTAQLNSPQVLAAALLQESYSPQPRLGETGFEGGGAFFVYSRTEDQARFTASQQTGLAGPGGPAEVMERVYNDAQRAIEALKAGEIDVLDRVFPGDLAELVDDPNLAVAQYAVPTTHLVVFRDRHPFLANRTFRRALAYALNRELILSQGLLGGKQYPGCQVISAPFPAPWRSDSPAYGYDQQIEPRAYDPRLGLTLRIISQNEVKSQYDKQQKPVPPLAPIVLGHPADETARIACRAIAVQWKAIGVEAKLVEFPPGVFHDPANFCDAIYLEAATWEPLIDASRLLGAEGLAPTSNGYIKLTLRQIEQATNWQQVRERFRQLHRQVHEDVTVLPLFQTHDHFAYRKSLQGLSGPRVTLYQNVEQWQVTPRLARAQP